MIVIRCDCWQRSYAAVIAPSAEPSRFLENGKCTTYMRMLRCLQPGKEAGLRIPSRRWTIERAVQCQSLFKRPKVHNSFCVEELLPQ
jgi:hypothetical protein